LVRIVDVGIVDVGIDIGRERYLHRFVIAVLWVLLTSLALLAPICAVILVHTI